MWEYIPYICATMSESVKRTVVNRGGQIVVEKTFRTAAEIREYKINNMMMLETLGTVAQELMAMYGGELSFVIESSQDDGLLGFTRLDGKNLPCAKYTQAYCESGCRDEHMYHKKFPWVNPYTVEYMLYKAGIDAYLLNKSKQSTTTLYCMGELVQSKKECIKRWYV